MRHVEQVTENIFEVDIQNMSTLRSLFGHRASGEETSQKVNVFIILVLFELAVTSIGIF